MPPPAPVPTMTKSTASSYRIFPHRHPCARAEDVGGASVAGAWGLQWIIGHGDSPDAPSRRSRRHFGCFPWIALVKVQTDIAARTCRSAPSDFAPCGGMGVIGKHDISRHTSSEKIGRTHAAPCGPLQFAALHALQARDPAPIQQGVKARAVSGFRFRIESMQAQTPRLAFTRHSRHPIAIGVALVQFTIDQRRRLESAGAKRLGHDASRDRVDGFEFLRW